MAVGIGRGCTSYGIHLLAYMPSAPCPSAATRLLGPFVRLNISFVLRFASSSCRSRTLMLNAAPSRSFGSFSLCSRDGVEIAREASRSATGSRKPHAKKQASSSEKGDDTCEEPGTGLEQTSSSSTRPASRSPRKKRVSSLEKGLDTSEPLRISLSEAEQSGDTSTPSVTPSRRPSAKKRASSPRHKLTTGEDGPVSSTETEQSCTTAIISASTRKKKSSRSSKESEAGESGGNPRIPAPVLGRLLTKKRASSLQKQSNIDEEVLVSSEQSGVASPASASPSQKLPVEKPATSLKKELNTGEQELVPSVEAEQSGTSTSRPSSRLRKLPTKKQASAGKTFEICDEARGLPGKARQSGASSTRSASHRQKIPANIGSPVLEDDLDTCKQGDVPLVEADQISSTLRNSAPSIEQLLTKTGVSFLEKEFDTGDKVDATLVDTGQTGGTSLSLGRRLVTNEQGFLFQEGINTSEEARFCFSETEKAGGHTKGSASSLPCHLPAKKQISSLKKNTITGEEVQVPFVESEDVGGKSICTASISQQVHKEEKQGLCLEEEVDTRDKAHASPVEEVVIVSARTVDQITSRNSMLDDSLGSQKQRLGGRSPRREGSTSKVTSVLNEEWKADNEHCVEQTTGFTQASETNDRQQFVSTTQSAELQQGYATANFARASGLEKKNRKQFSVRNVIANQASTISYMQIFGTGFDTGDTAPTVLLFFDRRRFLFNVGEGLHRFCNEHKFKLSKIDYVLLTRICSETVGGLPGLILTLAEMNESGLTVKTWGPSGLDDLAQAMRIFLPSGWIQHIKSFGPGANDHILPKSSSSSPLILLEDELIKISAVLLSSENSADIRTYSTVYVCELSTVRGKFDPDKARAKGLRPGYKYGRLQHGESVLSDDGSIMVHPTDVLGPSSPGPIILVVDCPSTSYISSLTSSTSLQSFFSKNGKVVNCMIHISPTSVTKSEGYQSWMQNFKDTHHIMARPEVKVLGMPTLINSAKNLSKLNLVCPWLFPVVDIDADKDKDLAGGHVMSAKNLLKYCLRPLSDLGPDGSEVPEVFNYNASSQQWDRVSPELLKAHDMALHVWKKWSENMSATSSRKSRANRNSESLPSCLQDVSRKEMELVFLGTGSSQPSKYRNVTGIYIHLFEKGGILLDCGEGTLAQLKRRYGVKVADEIMLGLKCIWISHLHADHFAGIFRLLSARRELLQATDRKMPILVIGPRKLKVILDAYGKIDDLAMEFLDCSQTTLEVKRWAESENTEDGAPQQKEGLINGSARGAVGRSGMQHIWRQPGYHIQHGIDVSGRMRLAKVLDLLGLKDLYSIPVIHCPNAFAVVLEAQEQKLSKRTSKPGWKLVFSGDTRPCQAVAEAAHKATILIHEATFEEDLLVDAVKKNHSTTQEAINVGISADVYRIFLTHFSQRYPIIPHIDDGFGDRACIAFDMMSVNLADLPMVPEFSTLLETLFKDQSDVEEEVESTNAFST